MWTEFKWLWLTIGTSNRHNKSSDLVNAEILEHLTYYFGEGDYITTLSVARLHRVKW
jgi:hypothetical protein